jgi:hypothetical protein
MAPRDAGSSARINPQGMAAIGQMAGGIRRLFRWGEAQCGVRSDAGQDRIGQKVGFFLSGINEDRLSEAYRDYRPGRDFLEIPIWLIERRAGTNRFVSLQVDLQIVGAQTIFVCRGSARSERTRASNSENANGLTR